ncbi:MAG TPA: ROK family protein [Pyrinomonadaceae bacterium]|jgi:glucokinase
MSKQAVAGIDIGGTKIAVALSDTDGRLLSLSRFATRLELGPYVIMEEAAKEVERLIEEAGARLLAVGVGCGGPLDRERGLILSSPNLTGWDEFPLIPLLEERFKVPALLENDANAAALGEYQRGAGRGLRDIVYITISTGIGGGIIIGGKLLHGVYDGAGEVGHTTVLPGGPKCGCGARGCMEAICSGTSIARRARERLSSGARSVLREMGGGIDAVTARMVAEAAREGDALATEIWDETVYYLAVGIGNIVNILAPEAVILGGGVSTSGEQLLEPLRHQVRSSIKMLPPDKINILQAALGGDSAIHGALILGARAIA